jgi:dihydrofolate synthase / folylpolyglutamate synthase
VAVRISILDSPSYEQRNGGRTMFQTYNEALHWIHSRLRLGMKPGLKRMEWMLEQLGHPERNIRSIHIGGTNGKGSTTSFLRSILQEAEYMVGTFTSPYIETFNERISINGRPISDEDILIAANKIKPLADELEKTELGGPTEFEIITTMAIYYFGMMQPVDVVIFEVGLGGRFDSTNVIHPMLSIITNVGYDHTNILGSTLQEIAKEKAGIIKNGVPVITGTNNEEALEVIIATALEKKSRLFVLGDHFAIQNYKPTQEGEQFSFQSLFVTYHDLITTMKGKHQTENASLAVMAAVYLKTFFAFLIEEEHIRNGIQSMYWPGRFEVLNEHPLVIVDGAHNPEGIERLLETIIHHYPDRKIHFLFTALDDKNIVEMIRKLDEYAESIAFTEIDMPRASKADKLYEKSNSKEKRLVIDWKEYLDGSIKNLTNGDLLVVTGSLYFISDVRKYLKNKK